MITQAHYMMGRDVKYADECSESVRANAQVVIERVNRLLDMAAYEGIRPGVVNNENSCVASGWRPVAINDKTSNAAGHSPHIMGAAIDVRDTGTRLFARWCLRNIGRLQALGLWMEDPRWTPSWVHLQIMPPRSGRRIFIPSSAPALCAALPEQQEG